MILLKYISYLTINIILKYETKILSFLIRKHNLLETS